MTRQVIDFLEEPQGESFRRLLQAFVLRAESVLAVLRDGADLHAEGRALLSRLEPYLLERKRGSSWPGTTLLGGEAAILRWRCNQVVVDELTRAARGLYDWAQPALPEDLAFIRADGSAMLASIAHEHDAYLELTASEFQDILAAVPELATITRVRSSS